MLIKLNGEPIDTNEGITIKNLIKSQNINPKSVVVEYNYKIIATKDWENIALKPNDSLEIVSFVGGG